ncbi:hypothetical protein L6164_033901 [Bauhinia variegata]|uniref:Uncharacterized protein n=1 Tax=Bauhinia variegata TaxID=167791 RepID=A0ACB9KT76_BAUVA|nr:hypothetical protein L6164_033901 [Bauhinia variegata]
MVVKMMRWRPWPPLVSRKYEVKLIVKRLEGCDLARECADKGTGEVRRLSVEIRWKGPKLTLSSLRRVAVARNFTREVEVDALTDHGVVRWDEEFHSLCNLSAYKDNVFLPWEIAFTVFNGLNQRTKNKVPIVGTASVNLAEFASASDQKDFELNIPLTLPGGAVEPSPSLSISVSLVELRAAQETMELVQRAIVPVPSPPRSGETALTEKDELSAIKAGLRKVKILTEYVSTRKAKKACREEEGSEGRSSTRSEDGEYNYPFDSDSLDEFEERDSDEVKEDSRVRKSFSYGTLAYANYAGGSFYSSIRVNGDEDWVYYSNRKSDVGSSQVEDSTTLASEPSLQSSKRSILPWRKRKLSFRSPKAKGEPLLKKAYGEEGGDDIDFDRRQLSSDESSLRLNKTEDDSCANRSSFSDFGDDNFAIGSWEQKEVTSRDGHMKLLTQVFFASIDQRSERAAGESACTALVAVIADWFQNNRDLMPIKSQFDSLIREGSLEWRNLCENETYKERFPDKHFDLETVIQAKIRPLTVVPGKSFIGFFHPEGMDEGRFDFLHGAMSFDNIWDEITRAGAECPSDGEPRVYVVSWNDHFFILKVEADAYYIIDTLGERLYEGCNQAYILKFDSSTVIHKIPNAAQSSEEKTSSDQQTVASVLDRNNNKQTQQVNCKEVDSAAVPEEQLKCEQQEGDEVVCRGKEACKEYIKSFLAAIPIRELQADIKKGLMSSTPLHHRLQIEFHYTQLSESHFLTPAAEVPQALALAVTGVSA